MKKYIVLGLILPLFTYAEGKRESIIPHQNTPIIFNGVNYLDNEARYGVYIYSSNCSFEILVNDIPVIKYNDNSGRNLEGSYFPLNEGISKKGNQKVSIRMTPGFNKEQNTLHSIFSPDSGMKIKFVKSFKNKTGDLEENEVQTYSTFKKKIANNTIFEDKFTFFADVPYHIETLENADVLQTPDQEKLRTLENEVVAKYNKIRDIYISGSWSALANIYYNKEKRIAKQLFLLPNEVKERWNHEYVFRTHTNIALFDVKPIEDYKMTFYADGKIVCLQKIEDEKPALWGTFKRKGKDNVMTTYITLYLYRPKDGSSLEVY